MCGLSFFSLTYLLVCSIAFRVVGSVFCLFVVVFLRSVGPCCTWSYFPWRLRAFVLTVSHTSFVDLADLSNYAPSRASYNRASSGLLQKYRAKYRSNLGNVKKLYGKM